jgi:hypothetical protein
MIGMKFNAAKNLFFDRKTVKGALTATERKVLNQFGGLTRKIAKNSMKNLGKRARTKIAALQEKLRSVAARVNPAYRARIETELEAARQKNRSPPGKPPRAIVGTIKKLLVYAADLNRRSVVIGPTLSNKPTGAPRTLEEGGRALVGFSRRAKKRRVKIARRPYMLPAFKAAKTKLPQMWKDSVKPK